MKTLACGGTNLGTHPGTDPAGAQGARRTIQPAASWFARSLSAPPLDPPPQKGTMREDS